jgi:hypothetical protein
VLVAVRAALSCDALLLLLDLAELEALLLAELEAALDALEAFAAREAVALELFAADALRVELEVPEFAVEEFEVELLAAAPFDASAV